MKLLVAFGVLGFSSVSVARSLSHYLSKTVVVQEDFTDPNQDILKKLSDIMSGKRKI